MNSNQQNKGESSHIDDGGNVKVVCRFRPENKTEIEKDGEQRV